MQKHLHVTASGLFSQLYLQWTLEVLGADRILFATDYRFARVARGTARTFLQTTGLSDAERTKIAAGNWKRLTSRIQR
jgi:predicted TIM-barrel fold metal-dependent hydrolase